MRPRGSADILRPGIDDARHLTGLTDPDAIVDFYLRMGPKIVALTLGEDGALIATAERRELLQPITVRAVDATGAGDVFDGAFLAEYLRTGDPFAAGRYANVAAALSTTGYGAVAPMPRRPEVEAALLAARQGERRCPALRAGPRAPSWPMPRSAAPAISTGWPIARWRRPPRCWPASPRSAARFPTVRAILAKSSACSMSRARRRPWRAPARAISASSPAVRCR